MSEQSRQARLHGGMTSYGHRGGRRRCHSNINNTCHDADEARLRCGRERRAPCLCGAAETTVGEGLSSPGARGARHCAAKRGARRGRHEDWETGSGGLPCPAWGRCKRPGGKSIDRDMHGVQIGETCAVDAATGRTVLAGRRDAHAQAGGALVRVEWVGVRWTHHVDDAGDGGCRERIRSALRGYGVRQPMGGRVGRLGVEEWYGWSRGGAAAGSCRVGPLANRLGAPPSTPRPNQRPGSDVAGATAPHPGHAGPTWKTT